VIIREFRKYYEEIVKKSAKPEVYDFRVPLLSQNQDNKELENNINILSKLVDTAWRGQNVEIEDLKKVLIIMTLIVMLFSFIKC